MKYKFNSETKHKLKAFKKHLKEKGYRPNTIRQKGNYAGYYLQWLENERMEAQEARYNDMLNFIDCCNLEGMGKKHINTVLLAIRNYYEHLKKHQPDIANPAINLKVKGEIKRTVSHAISYEKLEKLYSNYVTKTNRDKRNKAILGILVYQGITTEELHQLETGHIMLNKGKIFIPGSRKRSSRELDLKPFQILELNEYLSTVRLGLINGIDKEKPMRSVCRPGRKPNKINPAKLEKQLFFSSNGSENLKSSLLHLFRQIKKHNPQISSAKRIRASVISYWLTNFNLKQVQYMAGHKYVSSTERYQANNLEDMKKSLEKYHPLK
jgi:integrase/recombinase XerD